MPPLFLLDTLGYTHKFPVSTSLSNKVFDLEWSGRLVDDLTLGINLFTLGYLVEEDVSICRTIMPKRMHFSLDMLLLQQPTQPTS